MSLYIRKSEERGHVQHGWLNTYHTFSFASYYDPNFIHFGPLRVINEDRIEGGMGFGTHPHDNMEIITYIIEGALEHKDSMGNGSVINKGDIQTMSAGTGITHSEFNPLPNTTTHLLQIWIIPDKKGYTPSYGQKNFSDEEKKGKLCLIVSNDGKDGSLSIHQKLNLYSSIIDGDDEITHEIEEGHVIWLQMVKGSLLLNGEKINQGDGIAVKAEEAIHLKAEGKSEFLLFDMG